MSHEEIRSLIAPYVLGAVSEQETVAVRGHIATCDECLAEVDGYSDVVSSLALAVDHDELPEGFIEEVMARVGAERSDAPVRSAAPVPVATGRAAAPVVPLRRRGPASAIAAAAMLVAIAVLSVALLDARSDLGAARDQIDRFAELATEQGGMRLAGRGEAVMVPTAQGGIFLASGLEAVPEDRTYQVWLLREGEDPASAGTFEVADGVGTLATDLSLEGVEGVAVTVERAGGAPAPTGDPVLST